jgi:hypothetical protein
VFTAIAVAATLTLGVVALDASQSSPPAVAEFAPAALNQVKNAPNQLGAQGNPPTATPTPSTTASHRATTPSSSPTAAIDQPAVRQCVGDPPRQIEDPQSPPCVNYWKGDNGGATSYGVARDEIRIAVPQGTAFETPRDDEEAIASFFNTHFEFYGRKIRLEPYYVTGNTFAEPVPKDMIADARYAYSPEKAFASLQYLDRKGAEMPYYDELSRLKIVSVQGGGMTSTEAHLRAHAPYEWSFGTATDVMFANLGQFTCAQLVGNPAKYGGPYSWSPTTPTRTFGVLSTHTPDGSEADVSPLLDALRACNVKATVIHADQAQQASDAVDPIVQLSQAHVSTVICVCDGGSLRNYLTAAEGQGYEPEWEVSSYLGDALDNTPNQTPPDQAQHIIGLSFNNKYLPNAQMPWYTAMRQGNPNASIPTGTTGYQVDNFYQALLLVASGIQEAGPHLTPATFQQGLQRAHFPDPGVGAPPYYQSGIGYASGSHAMKTDAGMVWFDNAQPGTENPQSTGAICWVRHGERHGLDGWRRQQPAFGSGSCL